MPSVHFRYGPTAKGNEIGPDGMPNKVLIAIKYSAWDRCQGIGRGCSCAYCQARGSSTFEEYSQEMSLPTSPLSLKRLAEYIYCQGQLSNRQPETTYRRTHSSGSTQRQRVIGGAPVSAKWEAFLKSNVNKD